MSQLSHGLFCDRCEKLVDGKGDNKNKIKMSIALRNTIFIRIIIYLCDRHNWLSIWKLKYHRLSWHFIEVCRCCLARLRALRNISIVFVTPHNILTIFSLEHCARAMTFNLVRLFSMAELTKVQPNTIHVDKLYVLSVYARFFVIVVS